MSYAINDINEVSDNSIFRANINPVTVQSISIERVIPDSKQYCVQYELFGCPITTEFLLMVPIIEYGMSIVPVSNTNSDYTGVCEYGMCIGGIGKLFDGERGDISKLELNNESEFYLFTGNETALNITIRLSHYYYISTVCYHHVEIDINDFSSGKLENESKYSINRKEISINRPEQTIVLQIPLNSSKYLAIYEIEIIGYTGANIQNYFTTPYQPQICSITPNDQTVTFPELIQNYILIFSVAVLAFVLCLLVLVIILLTCVIIYTTWYRKTSGNRIEDLVQSKLHESTMNLAQNRLATYADINEDEIQDFRRKLRERLVSDECLEMEQVFQDESGKTDDQLFSSLMNTKSSPLLFPIGKYDDNANRVSPLSSEGLGNNSEAYDRLWRSNKKLSK
ncbi:hypothetical protein LOD99_14888 [Oopsacas minuta]|uniref:Uncharacterized protein n=1 Tax=Oopsacas minuta TaxID=111878 RepID=A0AAV7KET1_9METZ|nr:hypothetical protein LOD99_14888 [Oopsacas minuta]